jgi:DNA polymerase III subunit delta
MTYLILGNSEIVKEHINKIVKDNNINKESISSYDLETNNIFNVLEDINTLNIFSDKKLVIVYNIEFLVKKDDKNNDLYVSELIKYLNNQSDNILIISGKSLPNRKKLLVAFDSFSTKIEVDNFDINSYIKELLNGYRISNNDIELLKTYCSNDLLRIKNELEKLKLYRLDDKQITRDDIEFLVKKDLDKTIFDLINSVEKGTKNRSFDIYKELKEQNEEDMKILSMLANNYRLIYQVKNLTYTKTDDEIKEILGIANPKRISVLRNKGYNYTNKDLEDILIFLAELDYKIKTGLIDKETAVYLFLAR